MSLVCFVALVIPFWEIKDSGENVLCRSMAKLKVF